jgi:hypothetical protein
MVRLEKRLAARRRKTEPAARASASKRFCCSAGVAARTAMAVSVAAPAAATAAHASLRVPMSSPEFI